MNKIGVRHAGTLTPLADSRQANPLSSQGERRNFEQEIAERTENSQKKPLFPLCSPVQRNLHINLQRIAAI
jgi:hypothetical protein